MEDWITDILKQVTGTLLAISPMIIPEVRDFVVKKIQLSFDKALEDKKSLNERKNYISKVKFDREFELYQTISRNQMEVILDCKTAAIMVDKTDFNDYIKQREFLKSFWTHIQQAETDLNCNAPFISKSIFEYYQKIDTMAKRLYEIMSFLSDMKSAVLIINSDTGKYDDATTKEKVKEIQRDISNLLDEVHQAVREHLESLEAI